MINISHWLETLTLNLIVKIIAGKRYKTHGLEDDEANRSRKAVTEFLTLSGQSVLSDMIPITLLKWVDIKGVIKSMKRIKAELDVIIGSWIDEHDERASENERDFVDVLLSLVSDDLLEYGHTKRTIIKATIVQHHGCITLSVPHVATEDCNIAGYNIPRGTYLLVNLWKLHRDPEVWADAEEFRPERFLPGGDAYEVDFLGQHFEYIPFGSGRRSCPGITFAMQVNHLVLARLLQGFEFSMPSHSVVDMTEGLSISLPKAIPLEILVCHLVLGRLIQGFEFGAPPCAAVDMTEGVSFSLPRAKPLEVLVAPRLASALGFAFGIVTPTSSDKSTASFDGVAKSKPWSNRATVTCATKVAYVIPGQDRLPEPNGTYSKCAPEASSFAWVDRNLSGMNFSGSGQNLGSR
nr:hypothetical protein VITISV_016031 [Ipomoea trifida]